MEQLYFDTKADDFQVGIYGADVTHVQVDRVACPWLIIRFIDNEVEFLLPSR